MGADEPETKGLNTGTGGAVQPFYLTGSSDQNTTPLLRGRFARLTDTSHSILTRHAYPDSVSGLCAEAMSLAACLSTTLKFEGVFTLQAKGDGAVRTLFADVTSKGAVRSYAAFDAEKLTDLPLQAPAILPRLMGGGYIAFTVDQDAALGEEAHRYQGIVELDGSHLGDSAVAWFKNSEQLSTQIITAASKTDAGWHGAALFLQQVAGEGGHQAGYDADQLADEWHTAMVMMSSVTRDELLDATITAPDLLYRLFHAQNVHLHPARPIFDQCRCSAEKVEQVLRGLSPEQRADMCDEAGQLEVTCEFCKINRSYHLHEFEPSA
jgi:molecular chaperone Hsp33